MPSTIAARADLNQAVIPLSGLPAWAAALRQVAAQPLALCPDFPAIARRLEAWWAHDLLDRPVLTGGVNPKPERPITRRLELLHDPDAWFAAKYADMLQVHRVGDSLPSIRLQFGWLGGSFGCKSEYSSDTSWTYPTINDDWSSAPDWKVNEEDADWKRAQTLARRVAQDAVGRYLVMSSGFGMGGDMLMSMRGSTELCLDLIEQPERVRAAIDAIYPAWHRMVTEEFSIVTGAGAGWVQSLGLWSSRPCIIPQCDFSFMISTPHFERIFLPEIARQAATVGRAVFHLDGPGVARHIEAILQVPDIQAIQWVPGDGSPSPLPWIDMLRMIQRRGRSLQVICPPLDVLPLCDALRPEGLAIAVSGGSLTCSEMDDLFAAFCHRYGCA
jgi:5-methyltetrahydrofolate--homocysteine methyltransferase